MWTRRRVATLSLARMISSQLYMPMTLLIDRIGKIAVSYTGVVDKRTCESEIKALLEESAHKVLGHKVVKPIGYRLKVAMQGMPL